MREPWPEPDRGEGIIVTHNRIAPANLAGGWAVRIPTVSRTGCRTFAIQQSGGEATMFGAVTWDPGVTKV
jgi:hypothetical protein